MTDDISEERARGIFNSHMNFVDSNPYIVEKSYRLIRCYEKLKIVDFEDSKFLFKSKRQKKYEGKIKILSRELGYFLKDSI
jgi:hypothetical protein